MMVMHIDRLPMVARIADERAHLQADIADLKIGLSINGVRQDDTIIELVKPVILGELRARVRRLDLDLQQLGVETGRRTSC